MKMLPVILLMLAGCSVYQEDPQVCYSCVIFSVTERCDTVITEIITEEPTCNWTEGDSRAYQEKNTFVIDEKCFILRQECKCFRTVPAR